jgi:hypothetical protein
MKTFRISNRTSGVEMGLFSGETPADALDAMAREAGYESNAAALKDIGGDNGDLIVEEVAE